jgi:hypothetical protein
MRRALLLVILIAGCGGRSSSGPAWPKMTEKETDGGESLAPRTAAASVVGAAADGDDDVKVVPTAAATDKPAAAVDKPATVGTPTVTAPDDTITVEEIVIEIDD